MTAGTKATLLHTGEIVTIRRHAKKRDREAVDAIGYVLIEFANGTRLCAHRDDLVTK